jgi:hypothetical protein
MPHRLASDGFLVAARRREIWVGWEWAGYLLRARYMESTLSWRLLLRRATATAFDDTAWADCARDGDAIGIATMGE